MPANRPGESTARRPRPRATSSASHLAAERRVEHHAVLTGPGVAGDQRGGHAEGAMEVDRALVVRRGDRLERGRAAVAGQYGEVGVEPAGEALAAVGVAHADEVDVA